ncbi:MAG: hypothetical protein QXP80_04210 [Zestosphaera sp.]
MRRLKSEASKTLVFGLSFGVVLGFISYALRASLGTTEVFVDLILLTTYFASYPIYMIMYRLKGGLGRPKGISIIYSVSFIIWIATFEILVRYLGGVQ